MTRSRNQASKLSEQLRSLGATVIEIPTIEIVPPRSWEPLDDALGNLSEYAWLIVTSANTVRVMAERLAARSLRLISQPRTVAVGPATAQALEEAGFRVDLVPQLSVAESIVAALKDQVRGQRVLLIRAEVARDLLPVELGKAGAQVTIVDAYRTVLPAEAKALVAATFRRTEQQGGGGAASTLPVEPRHGARQRSIDALTFTSSSTVTNLAALLRDSACDWPAGARVYSIGPLTSQTLRDHGLEPDLEASRHDVEGLVERVLEGLGSRGAGKMPTYHIEES